ncbi:beta-1,6-N-acetylglucosaminyltransferase [Plastorhodobacter daqingensis]|uniref:Peptide O-xylosyltransferase n=1 Tax=Plastorhodobacter daqingensis TaxID=1387281 RepID=A0ABW2UFG4_9RHOB
MSVGFIMLCHTALNRAAQVARHWARADCPVVLHVDRRVRRRSYDELVRKLSDLPNVRFCERHSCEWGTWSLVTATQAAARMMLREFPKVDHVFHASGSCLPLRPVQELRDYLAQRPTTDFIESVTTEDVSWTVDGLERERFQFWFPFSWKRQRKLFDLTVRLQRRFRIRRRIPKGVVPHLGSQWWCLSRATLSAILNDPRRAEYDRYFRKVWIPDESYFQSLVRLHARTIESRSLTLSKFDFQGKPHIFYDDHLRLLRRSDCFVARKIWPQANLLYRVFLSEEKEALRRAEPNPGRIDRIFSTALERRTRGRPGLYMQSRFPRPDRENSKTAAPYSLFSGFAELFEGFEPWMAEVTGTAVHGKLFAPDRVHYAGGVGVYRGGLSDSAALRDREPRGFLTSLIWNTRGERQCFQFGPGDTQALTWFLATDHNAQIAVISGAWAIPLFRSNRNFADIRREAARLQQVELDFLKVLRSPWTKARLHVWTLADFIDAPRDHLHMILDEMNPRAHLTPGVLPPMVSLDGFGAFLQNLRNEGMQPLVMGDFRVAPPRQGARQTRTRGE